MHASKTSVMNNMMIKWMKYFCSDVVCLSKYCETICKEKYVWCCSAFIKRADCELFVYIRGENTLEYIKT